MARPFVIFVLPKSAYFILISNFILSNAHYFPSNKQLCGTLYSGANGNDSTGLSFLLRDQDYSINLMEDERASGSGWNVTGSVSIEEGCQLAMCTGTYLDGDCNILKQGSHAATENGFMTYIKSAECTCTKVCKCSEIHIKKSSCGRAYLEGGCRTCDTLYSDLLVNQSTRTDYFAKAFMEKVEAIRLRKGCTLTAYSEPEFDTFNSKNGLWLHEIPLLKSCDKQYK